MRLVFWRCGPDQRVGNVNSVNILSNHVDIVSRIVTMTTGFVSRGGRAFIPLTTYNGEDYAIYSTMHTLFA